LVIIYYFDNYNKNPFTLTYSGSESIPVAGAFYIKGIYSVKFYIYIEAYFVMLAIVKFLYNYVIETIKEYQQIYLKKFISKTFFLIISPLLIAVGALVCGGVLFLITDAIYFIFYIFWQYISIVYSIISILKTFDIGFSKLEITNIVFSFGILIILGYLILIGIIDGLKSNNTKERKEMLSSSIKILLIYILIQILTTILYFGIYETHLTLFGKSYDTPYFIITCAKILFGIPIFCITVCSIYYFYLWLFNFTPFNKRE